MFTFKSTIRRVCPSEVSRFVRWNCSLLCLSANGRRPRRHVKTDIFKLKRNWNENTKQSAIRHTTTVANSFPPFALLFFTIVSAFCQIWSPSLATPDWNAAHSELCSAEEEEGNEEQEQSLEWRLKKFFLFGRQRSHTRAVYLRRDLGLLPPDLGNAQRNNKELKFICNTVVRPSGLCRSHLLSVDGIGSGHREFIFICPKRGLRPRQNGVGDTWFTFSRQTAGFNRTEVFWIDLFSSSI